MEIKMEYKTQTIVFPDFLTIIKRLADACAHTEFLPSPDI